MTVQTSMPFRDDVRDAEHELNRTPAALPLQMFRWLHDVFGWQPRRILDPSAGSGVFGEMASLVWPEAHLTAVEPREEEIAALERTYDVVHHGRLEDVDLGNEGLGFDLIVTNPPFSLALEWAADLVWRLRTNAGAVCFLQLDDFGQRSEAGHEAFRKMPPSWQLRIPGAVAFRGGTSDARSYSWWLFQYPGLIRRRSAWSTYQLPRLSASERRHG